MGWGWGDFSMYIVIWYSEWTEGGGLGYTNSIHDAENRWDGDNLEARGRNISDLEGECLSSSYFCRTWYSIWLMVNPQSQFDQFLKLVAVCGCGGSLGPFSSISLMYLSDSGSFPACLMLITPGVHLQSHSLHLISLLSSCACLLSCFSKVLPISTMYTHPQPLQSTL